MGFNITLLAQLLNFVVLFLAIYLIYKLFRYWINNINCANNQRKEIIKKLDDITESNNRILELLKNNDNNIKS